MEALVENQRSVLWKVLWINFVMFFIELGGGWIANSTALMADSLDMLGDTIVYAFSLLVISKPPVWRNRAAFLKGVIMALFGIGILVEAAHKIGTPIVPAPSLMWVLGGLALFANSYCLYLLTRHRADDLNMKSTWLCSRNDLIANSGVIIAALLVGVTGKSWPDLVVGTIIATVFLRSAFSVLRDSWSKIKPATTV